MPEKEWANELSRLHGNEGARNRIRFDRLLTLLVLTAAIVVLVLTLA